MGNTAYWGEITTDHYGRKIPKHAHGTQRLGRYTASTRLILEGVTRLYDRIVDPSLLIRRMNLTANRVVPADSVSEERGEQLDLFTDYAARQREREAEERFLERERRRQRAVLDIKKKFGKNAILRGMDLEEGATTVARNQQIGGHKA